MAVIGVAEIEVVPVTKGFAAKAQSETEGEAKSFGSHIGGVIAGAAAAVGAFEFVKGSVEAFSEAQQSTLKLNASLQANTATVGLNASAFDGLNKKLMEHSTFNTEASQTVEGQLALYHLTAAQIKDLTPLVEDYAARTGKDVTSAAKLAGAALLGKGRALKDVGINFKDLKDPTKNYTELVDGLRQQVGGFANKEGSTFAGRMKILHNEFHEFQVEVGEKVVPILTQFLGVIVDRVIPVIGSLIEWFSHHRTAAIVLGAAIGGILVAATVAWTVSLFAAGGALAFLISPVTLVVAAVGLLALGVIWVYQHVQVFHDIVNAIADYFATKFVPQMQAVGAFIVEVWNRIYSVGKTVFDAIGVAVQLFIDGPVKFLSDQIAAFSVWWSAHWDEIRAIFVFVFDAISAYMHVWWDVVVGLFHIAADVILPLVQIAWQQLQGAFHIAFDLIAGIVRVAWDVMVGIFKTTRDIILGVVGVFLDLLTGHWSRAWDGIKSTVTNVLGDINGAIGKVLGDVIDTVKNLAGSVETAAKGIGTAIVHGITGGIAALADDIYQAIKKVIEDGLSRIPGPLKKAAGVVFGFAEGGWVPGSPGVPQLAVVHGGEFVLSRDMLAGVRSAPIGPGAAAGGGAGGVSVSVSITMPGLATSPEAVALIRSTAQGEFASAVTRALDAAAAGAGSRAGG